MSRRAIGACGALAAVTATIAYALSRPAEPARSGEVAARATNLPPLPPPLHPATRLGVELGRRLFFDPRLSGDDRISCATCHAPNRAFSDGVARATHGASGRALDRHAPALVNLAWVPALFWDGGATNLESMAFAPILHEDEMGEDVVRLVTQLREDPEMVRAFRRAFPSMELAPPVVMRALAQYMRSLISADSRYDRHVRGEPGGALTAQELRGLAVHRAKCASCHATDLFTDHAFHDIGLDPHVPLDAEDPRRGRARISFQAGDERAFRTPALRNLSYTAPYMHDGRFATLEDVLDHYRHGTHHTPSLARELVRDDGVGIALSGEEVSDLRAFLATLDDPAFLARHVTAARTDRRASDR